MNKNVVIKHTSGFWGLIFIFFVLATMSYTLIFGSVYYFYFPTLLFTISIIVILLITYFISINNFYHFIIYQDGIDIYYPFRKLNKKISITNDQIKEISCQIGYGTAVRIKYLTHKNLVVQKLILNHFSNDAIVVLKHYQQRGVKLCSNSTKLINKK